MDLVNYIVRRVFTLIPVLFGVITIVFFLSRQMPGDPVLAYLNTSEIRDRATYIELYNHFFHELGLDNPIHIQYTIYIKDIFTGNWGYSFSINRGQDVWSLIWLRLPTTIDITLFSILIAAFLGIKSGIISAKHRNKVSDTFVRSIALIGVSIPVFFMGVLFQYFMSYKLQLFPAVGFKDMRYGDPNFVTGFRIIDALLSGEFYMIFDYLYHLFLPVLCLSFVTIAGISRQSRSSMLEVLEQDYIRTARAKGCEEKDIYRIHALKNSLIPTTTVIGLNLATLLSGAILTEVTFGINGIGKLLIDAIMDSDYWVLNALVLVISIMLVLIILVIDIIYSILDPRIRY